MKKETKSTKKKPVALFLTDTHLASDTIEINKSIFEQVSNLALELGVHTIYHGGDVFESRKGQPEAVLTAFGNILEESIEENDLALYVIPGNHDKTDYCSEESFLNPFAKYQSLRLIKNYATILHDKVSITLVPYFDEHLAYQQYLKEAIEDLKSIKEQRKSKILITHCAIDGVKNNSGEAVTKSLPQKAFEAFDSVLVGHYHDRQRVSSRVLYTGSAYQANFGECNLKGCTVIYDDGSTDLVQLKFPEYITTRLDVSTMTASQVQAFIDSKGGDNGRIQIDGDKGVNIDPSIKAMLVRAGIKIDDKRQQVLTSGKKSEIKVFTANDITAGFEEWGSSRKPANIEMGRSLLKNALNNL